MLRTKIKKYILRNISQKREKYHVNIGSVQEIPWWWGWSWSSKRRPTRHPTTWPRCYPQEYPIVFCRRESFTLYKKRHDAHTSAVI